MGISGGEDWGIPSRPSAAWGLKVASAKMGVCRGSFFHVKSGAARDKEKASDSLMGPGSPSWTDIVHHLGEYLRGGSGEK